MYVSIALFFFMFVFFFVWQEEKFYFQYCFCNFCCLWSRKKKHREESRKFKKIIIIMITEKQWGLKWLKVLFVLWLFWSAPRLIRLCRLGLWSLTITFQRIGSNKCFKKKLPCFFPASEVLVSLPRLQTSAGMWSCGFGGLSCPHFVGTTVYWRNSPISNRTIFE